MQTPMFVFTGYRSKQVADEAAFLMDRLNQAFAEQQLKIGFHRKADLLIARFENVGFYASLFYKQEELKDWFQMSDDFELQSEPNPVDYVSFYKRYAQKKQTTPELYKEIHYEIGATIFSIINMFEPVEIFFFQ